MYDPKTGVLMERADGTPEPRPIPPDCEGRRGPPCKKYLVEEMLPENYQAYSQYTTCKALGCLPMVGGLEDQDAYLMRKFEMLAMIDRQRQIAIMSARMASGMM